MEGGTTTTDDTNYRDLKVKELTLTVGPRMERPIYITNLKYELDVHETFLSNRSNGEQPR